MKTIAIRNRSKLPPLYVEFIKGDGGADWGYTTDSANAINLTPYWQRRFAADCRYVGADCRFVEVQDA